MRNPFRMALAGGDSGFENDSFDFPAPTGEMDGVSYPELDGLGGGVAAYRGPTRPFEAENPGYAGDYSLGYLDAPGLSPSYTPIISAPGSVDLAIPRGITGPSGTNRIIHSEGPVTGADSQFSGIRAKAFTPNPNNAGPVTGGTDYAQQLAATFFASQAQEFSAMAAAQALVAAV